MTEKKAPILRFKGFTDAWEQRKLGEIGEITTGSTPSTLNKDFYNGPYKFVSPVDINENRFIETTATTLSKLGFEKGRNIKRGSSLFVSIGSTIGKVAQIHDVVTTNQQINAVIPFDNMENDYIFTLIEKHSGTIRGLAAVQAVPIINKTTFSNVQLNISLDIEEQTKIGVIFKILDNTISLHQRKLERLNMLKKAYLQQLFPQANEKIPKLRFASFNMDWEQRKFKTIAARVSQTSDSDSLPKVEFEDIICGEGRLNKDISNKFDSRKGIIFESNDILYGKLRPYLKNWLFADFKGIALGDFWVLRATNTSPIFNFYLIQSEKYQSVADLSTGTKMPRSDWKVVSDTEFEIPRDLAEQTKIGDLLKNLDVTVSLHQDKLKKLKILKKAYLQKMFI